ncbi:carboxypeptidase-like regulatory domain-containing protein [Rubrivivax albus]|uniref:Carboxypeptidase regulatory-like domain-containing protein n=1 Tax=Rubrivivax albus TaxID=2499835 RepID=A0A437JYR3_9BURK|nr:carboxypeptidase-like regulatory domain-containing protein [Rubrivivax albus]RVT52804.1 hypothetical protein ENE75_10360 [Rubrivivax albus]
MPISRHHRTPLALSLIAAATLAACGGSGKDTPPPPAATLLQGTAAIGAPMAGASITVVDSDPATADPAAVTADADGRFSIDVSGLVAPLLLRASGTVDGEPVQHSAVVPSVTANQTGTANVTPLTTAIAALAAPGADPAALADPATLAGAAEAATAATTMLLATLATDSGTAALLPAGFDPLSTAFAADGTGADALLHRIAVAVGDGGVTLRNLAAAAGDGGAAPPVVLTADTTEAPTLPASVPADNLPSAADLATLGARWETCLALPVAERVTLDAEGQVTAVAETCRITVADWRSQGRSYAADVGQNVLAEGLLTGARVGAGSVVLALPPLAITDPKVFKHPYCNDSPCVIARWPMVTASGQPTSSEWVLGKVDGQWAFVGNQRPYNAYVQTRLKRKLNVNRAGAEAPDASYFLQDRYETVLRLIFDLSTGDTSDVRAVRWTGPGLPAAGVTMFRSQRCGTDDRMAMGYQNGSTRVIGGPDDGLRQWWTTGSASEFVLGAARLDGTALALPVPQADATAVRNQDFSPTAFGDLTTTVPDWAQYQLEIFRYSSASDEPDEVLLLRTGPGAENPSAGVQAVWPDLDPTIAEAMLKPGAPEVMDTDSVLRWTIPAGHYVSSGYLFGQDFATLSNGQDAAASYSLRGRVDYEPAAYGDTSAPAWRLASPVAGTALSPNTENSGSNPNPRCDVAKVPALTERTSDYREIGLMVRAGDRKVRQGVWFWDN